MSINEEKLKKTFGAALRYYRKEADLSQEKLAQEANLDRTFISMLERGLRQPSLITIFELAAILRIKPSQLVIAVEDKIKYKK